MRNKMREETAVSMYALQECLLSDTSSTGTHSCTRANCSLNKYVRLYVFCCVRTYVRINVWIYEYTCVCVCLCMYVRTHVCMYVKCSFILDLGMGAMKRVHSTFSFQLPVWTHNLKAAPKSLDSTTKWLESIKLTSHWNYIYEIHKSPSITEMRYTDRRGKERYLYK